MADKETDIQKFEVGQVVQVAHYGGSSWFTMGLAYDAAAVDPIKAKLAESRLSARRCGGVRVSHMGVQIVDDAHVRRMEVFNGKVCRQLDGERKIWSVPSFAVSEFPDPELPSEVRRVRNCGP